MKVAPLARFAVPTGTAAAVVVMREPTGDPVLDARRFAALESLDNARYRAAFEELIVAGVYTVLADRVLVLRISAHGAKSFAAALAIGKTAETPLIAPDSASTDQRSEPRRTPTPCGCCSRPRPSSDRSSTA